MRHPPAANTSARSQLHWSTMTGGYVQQVPYPEGGAKTRHSQLGDCICGSCVYVCMYVCMYVRLQLYTVNFK